MRAMLIHIKCRAFDKSVCVCVCVCVREREREREKWSDLCLGEITLGLEHKINCRG